jgi:hypothetical protein
MNENNIRPNIHRAAPPTQDGFEAYANCVEPNSIVGDLLRFSKGEYVAGQNGETVKLGTCVIAHMDKATAGWQKWLNRKVCDHTLKLLIDGFEMIPRDALGDLNRSEWERNSRGELQDPWVFSAYLICKIPDKPVIYTFNTSSKGGHGAIGKLARVYQRRKNPDAFPIVELQRDSYIHRNFGKVYVPHFRVVGWVSKSEMIETLGGVAEPMDRNDASVDLNDTPF